MASLDTNILYYGDNLDILQGHIPDESVDLIYLDPPFNSRPNLFPYKTYLECLPCAKVDLGKLEGNRDGWMPRSKSREGACPSTSCRSESMHHTRRLWK